VAEDYYERLGVDRNASESAIKAAFRERIKETHPDVSDDEAASDRTKALIEAKDVLTDSAERERYDRLGHHAYLSGDDSATATGQSPDSGKSTGWSASSAGRTQQDRSGAAGSDWSTAGQRAGPWSREGSAGETATTGSTETTETGDTASNWYDSSRRQRSTAPDDGTHRVWNADSSYTVNDTPGRFSPRELISSQRVIMLLGTTFVIYPVLLFGALFQPFPTAVNLTVGMCIVLVIAYLQSVPQVGIVVFGTWTVLLPIVLFGFVGVRVLSLQGVLSLTAVGFPFGLSVLTWIALAPTNR